MVGCARQWLGHWGPWSSRFDCVTRDEQCGENRSGFLGERHRYTREDLRAFGTGGQCSVSNGIARVMAEWYAV